MDARLEDTHVDNNKQSIQSFPVGCVQGEDTKRIFRFTLLG